MFDNINISKKPNDEAVDMFFLENGALRVKQTRCLNFIRAKA